MKSLQNQAAGMSHTQRRQVWISLAIILSVAAILRFYHLGHENFWIDEILTFRDSSTSPWQRLLNYWQIDDRSSPGTKQPLSYAVTHLTRRFTANEFLLRVPSALFGVAEVGAIFFVGRGLFSNRTALLAALFLAVAPLHIWYSQELRWYSRWSLVGTLSFLALLRAWRSSRSSRLGDWTLYGVATVVNLYTFVVSYAVILLQALATLWRDVSESDRHRTAALALTLSAVALVTLPSTTKLLGLLTPESSGMMVGTPRETPLAAIPYTFFAFVAGYSVGPTIAELHSFPGPLTILAGHPEVVLFFLVFGSVVAYGLWSIRRERETLQLLVPWAVGIPAAVFTAAELAGNTYNLRYTFVALPGLLLLLAKGIRSIESKSLRATSLGGVLVLFGFSLGNYYWADEYRRADVRGAVRHVASARLHNADVLVVGQVLPAVEYYGKRHELGKIECCKAGQKPLSGLAGSEEARSPLWVVVGRDWDDEIAACLDTLRRSYRVEVRWEGTGIRVFLALPEGRKEAIRSGLLP